MKLKWHIPGLAKELLYISMIQEDTTWLFLYTELWPLVLSQCEV